jgi:hypothetical protein
MPMKRIYTQKQNFDIQKTDRLTDMQPKQSTIDFLLGFAAAYEVKMLKGNQLIEVLVN